MDTEKYFSSTGARTGLSEVIKRRVTALQNNVDESGARRLLRCKINPLQPVATMRPQEQNVTFFFQENLVIQCFKIICQAFAGFHIT